MERKNIIFDIGGVLIDDKYGVYVKEKGLSQEKFSEMAEEIFGEAFHALMRGEIDTDEFKRSFEGAKYEADARTLFTRENCPRYLPAIVENIALLPKLKAADYKLYLLSNTGPMMADYFYSLVDREIFSGHGFSYEEGFVKPDERFYRRLLTKYDLAPETCVFFDDKKRNTDAAEALGIEGIVVEYPGVVGKYFEGKV